MEGWGVSTDNSFESLKLEDIEKIAETEGISDYNITTAPTVVKQENFERIEDPDTDQTNDYGGVTLIGNLDMTMDSNVPFWKCQHKRRAYDNAGRCECMCYF